MPDGRGFFSPDREIFCGGPHREVLCILADHNARRQGIRIAVSGEPPFIFIIPFHRDRQALGQNRVFPTVMNQLDILPLRVLCKFAQILRSIDNDILMIQSGQEPDCQIPALERKGLKQS